MIVKTGNLTVAVGSAIGRAIGNKGTELDRAQALEAATLPVGIRVTWRDHSNRAVFGTITRHVQGYYLTEYLVEIEGGGVLRKRRSQIEEVKGD